MGHANLYIYGYVNIAILDPPDVIVSRLSDHRSHSLGPIARTERGGTLDRQGATSRYLKPASQHARLQVRPVTRWS